MELLYTMLFSILFVGLVSILMIIKLDKVLRKQQIMIKKEKNTIFKNKR